MARGKNGWDVTKCTEFKPNVGNCTEPVYQQAHSADVNSINGGLIVDSCDWPAAFRGLYFFGDNVSGALWTVQPTPARDGIVAGSQKDFGLVAGPVSLRSGPDGALYIASYAGRIIKFEPKTKVPCPSPPDAGPDTGMSDTGTPDPDAGPIDDGGIGADGSVDDAGNPVDGGSADEGGCGCATPGSTGPRHGLAALALLALVVRRRR